MIWNRWVFELNRDIILICDNQELSPKYSATETAEVLFLRFSTFTKD